MLFLSNIFQFDETIKYLRCLLLCLHASVCTMRVCVFVCMCVFVCIAMAASVAKLNQLTFGRSQGKETAELSNYFAKLCHKTQLELLLRRHRS